MDLQGPSATASDQLSARNQRHTGPFPPRAGVSTLGKGAQERTEFSSHITYVCKHDLSGAHCINHAARSSGCAALSTDRLHGGRACRTTWTIVRTQWELCSHVNVHSQAGPSQGLPLPAAQGAAGHAARVPLSPSCLRAACGNVVSNSSGLRFRLCLGEGDFLVSLLYKLTNLGIVIQASENQMGPHCVSLI